MPVIVTRNSLLTNDIDGDGIADVGEALTIRVRITNTDPTSITNLQLFDTQNGLTIDPTTVRITPIAFDDTLPQISGNTPYTFSKAVLLGNDGDPNDPSATFTIQLGAGVNGTIVDNGDGTLTFTPATGFQGAASFTYTVTNTHQGENSISTATVSLNVSGQVWYVDSGYGGANGTADGSYLKPFNSLAQLNGVTGDGTTNDDVDAPTDTIFVYDRGASYSGGIVLEAGQKLYGDGHAFTVNGLTIGVSNTNAVISATTGTVVTLSTDNTIYGVTINTGAAAVTGLADGNGSVSSTTTSQGLIIDETSFTGTGRAIDIDQGGKLAIDIDSLSSGGATEKAIQLAGTAGSGVGLLTGSFNATTGIIQSATGQGFLIGVAGGGTAGSGGDVNVTYGGAITNPTGSAVEIQDRTGGTVTFTGTITDGSASANAGILVDGNAGSINFNAQTFINNGGATGVQVTNNTGTVSFNSTGNGLDITTSTGAGLVAKGGRNPGHLRLRQFDHQHGGYGAERVEHDHRRCRADLPEHRGQRRYQRHRSYKYRRYRRSDGDRRCGLRQQRLGRHHPEHQRRRHPAQQHAQRVVRSAEPDQHRRQRRAGNGRHQLQPHQFDLQRHRQRLLRIGHRVQRFVQHAERQRNDQLRQQHQRDADRHRQHLPQRILFRRGRAGGCGHDHLRQ